MLQKIFASSIVGIIAKIIDALAKFVTIPLLISFYGKSDYGLVALAFSLNAYLRLMDMGMNTGAIRFFSIWFANKDYHKILGASQSSIIFYGFIGLFNAGLLVCLGFFADNFFKLYPEQVIILRKMLFTLAGSAFFSWTAYVFNQLLIAHGEIKWTNFGMIVSSLINILVSFISVKFKLNLNTYFYLYVLSTLVIIPLNIYRLRLVEIDKFVLKLFKPKWDYSIFKEIQKYSIAIFAMGIFQFSADNLRPILLGIYSSKGASVLTDYRVLQTIIMLVSSMGAVFLQVLLPYASREVSVGNESKQNILIYSGTKYITIFLSVLIFGLIINIDDLIILFVGKEFLFLSKWLIINLLLMFYMHDYAISSIVLSIGKTRVLVFSSAIGAIVASTLTIFFANSLNVGSTVISFAGFILIQTACNYFYYIPKVLHLKGFNILLNSVLPAFLIGLMLTLISWKFAHSFNFLNIYLRIFLKSITFLFLFGTLTYLFILSSEEKRKMKLNFK